MWHTIRTVSIVLSLWLAGWAAPAGAASPLTAEMMIVGLRPESPSDRNYISYVAAVMEQGFVPHVLVESSFLWARKKPEHMARYFRQAMILRAGKIGITLPPGDAPTSGTIEGRAVYEVKLLLLTVTMPVSEATVTIQGTNLLTTADKDGYFTFLGVPFGTYMVRAEGKVSLKYRVGTIKVALPTRPPSNEPATVTILVE
jgi:hypothetical protein